MQRSGPALYDRAKTLIPGGTQLLTKRPEMHLPDNWPAYYSRASGADVWDLDGTRYVDVGYGGIGTCTLGFADPDVDAAAFEAIRAGTMCTLNCPEEVHLAERLCELHPWASMVRYARGGGEAMAVAVRIARAASGRDQVAFCGYHGWHDWYLAANLTGTNALEGHLLPGLSPAGVPQALAGSARPFEYNRLDQLEQIANDSRQGLAAIIMEPIRGQRPEPGFLEGVRRVADRTGAVLVLDEVTAGFRLLTGGAHLTLGLTPDIAVFAKALSNGYPMAAVIGTRAVMEAAQGTFISSTYWTERIGPAAALATLEKHQRLDVGATLVEVGRRVKAGWRAAADDVGLDLRVSGLDPLAHFDFEVADPLAVRTLFTQLMLDRGFLATSSFYATYSHAEAHLDAYLTAFAESLAAIRKAIEEEAVQQRLRGPVAHSGFRRLT